MESWIIILLFLVLLFFLSIPFVLAFAVQTIANLAANVQTSSGPGGFQVEFGRDNPWLLRYVVLHHTGLYQPHYDLMFETVPGSPLMTWRSPVWPIAAATQIERIDDHRRDYLEYEGPVSNNRGVVARVAQGHFQFESSTEELYRIRSADGLILSLQRIGQSTIWLAEVDQRATSCR